MLLKKDFCCFGLLKSCTFLNNGFRRQEAPPKPAFTVRARTVREKAPGAPPPALSLVFYFPANPLGNFQAALVKLLMKLLEYRSSNFARGKCVNQSWNNPWQLTTPPFQTYRLYTSRSPIKNWETSSLKAFWPSPPTPFSQFGRRGTGQISRL
jgi:hypothetical protein